MKLFVGWFGVIKALQARMLPDGFCTDAVNLRPGRGDLRPWSTKLNVASLPAGRTSMYRMGRDVASDANYWLSSPNDVDYVRSLNASDATERTYYTGEAEPRVTDNVIGIAGAPYPTAFRTLGVPAPTSVMTATITTVGVSATNEDRYYVDTFVTDQGEESAPGVPTVRVTCKTDAAITLNAFAAAPGGSTGITLRRIYRTRVATDGSTQFYQVAQIASGTASFVDNGVANGNVLQSDGGGVGFAWDPPPAGLRGLIGLWNGMMAGFIGKSIRFCVPYKPHAWPIGYEAIAIDSMVGGGTFGTTLVALTTDKPYALSGASPLSMVQSMDPIKCPFTAACIAKRSIVSFKHGVVWATPDGLAYVGFNGPQLLTAGVMLKEDWQALNPATIIGCQYGGLYFGFYTVVAVRKGFYINPLQPQSIIFMDSGAEAVWFDPISGSMYLFNGTDIQKWNAGGALMTASATSKIERTQDACNFSVAQVIADAYPVQLTYYGDGVQRHTVAVANKDPVPLPGGFLVEDHQVKVDTAVGGVEAVILADDEAELDRG